MTTDKLEVAPRKTKHDKIMSRAEVAAFIGVSTGTVDAYCRDEKDRLPSRKVRRRVLFWRSEVEKWLEDSGGSAGAAPAKPGRGGPRD